MRLSISYEHDEMMLTADIGLGGSRSREKVRRTPAESHSYLMCLREHIFWLCTYNTVIHTYIQTYE